MQSSVFSNEIDSKSSSWKLTKVNGQTKTIIFWYFHSLFSFVLSGRPRIQGEYWRSGTFINNNLIIYFRESFHDNFTLTLCLIVIFYCCCLQGPEGGMVWTSILCYIDWRRTKERTNEWMIDGLSDRTDKRTAGRVHVCRDGWVRAWMDERVKEGWKDEKDEGRRVGMNKWTNERKMNEWIIGY